MKIFVAGSLNMDLTIRAPYVPQKGETVKGEGFLVTPGGKGANQAVACAKLGAETLMVGCIGNEFGEELVASLQNCGADVGFVERKNEVSSGIAMIIVADGDNRIIIDRGANAKVDRALIDSALREAEARDLLIVQLEIETDTVCYALARAKERGMVTLLNPAPAESLPAEVFADCDYFLPNQSEAKFYTGVYPENEESAKRCAAILREKGVKKTVITMGERGSVCIGDKGFISVPAVKVKAVDTTAAGDTFIGAFATKLSEGADEEEAMRFANAAAAVTVTRRGAQTAIPSRIEADQMYKG